MKNFIIVLIMLLTSSVYGRQMSQEALENCFSEIREKNKLAELALNSSDQADFNRKLEDVLRDIEKENGYKDQLKLDTGDNDSDEAASEAKEDEIKEISDNDITPVSEEVPKDFIFNKDDEQKDEVNCDDIEAGFISYFYDDEKPENEQDCRIKAKEFCVTFSQAGKECETSMAELCIDRNNDLKSFIEVVKDRIQNFEEIKNGKDDIPKKDLNKIKNFRKKYILSAKKRENKRDRILVGSTIEVQEGKTIYEYMLDIWHEIVDFIFNIFMAPIRLLLSLVAPMKLLKDISIFYYIAGGFFWMLVIILILIKIKSVMERRKN